MSFRPSRSHAGAWALAFAVVAFAPLPVRAHCDTMDGPVVQAARAAIERGDPAPALAWVQPADEPAIRAAFGRALTVRRQSKESRELADQWFFETLVRVHRAGEGAPYTGLRPAGTPVNPAVEAADRALATGEVLPLIEMLTKVSHAGVSQRFEIARRARDHRPSDIEAGRRYVAAYVEFVHYAERIFDDASASAGHDDVPVAAPAHGH